MLIPYPYESGGSFKFLPVQVNEVHTQVSGEIKKVFVKEGDLVKKGQILALLDRRDHQKNLDVTKASLDKAKADLRFLELGPKPEEIEQAENQVSTAQTRYEYSNCEYERFISLYKDGVVSESEYMDKAKKADVDVKDLETAKAHLKLVKSGPRVEEIESQKAIIRSLETQLKYYKQNVSFTKICAPISGLIDTPYIEKTVGKVLEQGDFFVVVQNSETIQAEIQVQESDISEVRLGGRVKVRPWVYPSKLFYGSVIAIAPQAEKHRLGR